MEELTRKKVLNMSKRVWIINGSLVETNTNGKDQKFKRDTLKLQQDASMFPAEQHTHEKDRGTLSPDLTIGGLHQ